MAFDPYSATLLDEEQEKPKQFDPASAQLIEEYQPPTGEKSAETRSFYGLPQTAPQFAPMPERVGPDPNEIAPPTFPDFLFQPKIEVARLEHTPGESTLAKYLKAIGNVGGEFVSGASSPAMIAAPLPAIAAALPEMASGQAQRIQEAEKAEAWSPERIEAGLSTVGLIGGLAAGARAGLKPKAGPKVVEPKLTTQKSVSAAPIPEAAPEIVDVPRQKALNEVVPDETQAAQRSGDTPPASGQEAGALFPESNRLTNLDPNGASWRRIKVENPQAQPASDGTVTIYRATIGDELRPNDYVALSPDVAKAHLQNLKDRGESGKIITQQVSMQDLLMANDATEFIYHPRPEARAPIFGAESSQGSHPQFGTGQIQDLPVSLQERPTSSNIPVSGKAREKAATSYKQLAEADLPSETAFGSQPEVNPTSTKNAITALERESRGLPAAEEAARREQGFGITEAAPESVEVPTQKARSGEFNPMQATRPGVSKIGKSIEAKAVEAKLTKGFEGTALYEPITIAEQAQRATSFVKSSIAQARAVIRGEAPLPEGIRGTSLITAMEEHITRQPNAQLAHELANSPLTSATSVAAQEMRLMRERVPDSITAAFQEIRAAREAGSKQRGQTPERIVQEIKTEIARNSSKRPTWEAFVKEIICPV